MMQMNEQAKRYEESNWALYQILWELWERREALGHYGSYKLFVGPDMAKRITDALYISEGGSTAGETAQP